MDFGRGNGELVQCLQILGYGAYSCDIESSSYRHRRELDREARSDSGVGIMGVSGIVAGTAFMHMVGFAHLWWFSFSFTKQRKAS